MLFLDICHILQNLKENPKRLNKILILRDFYKDKNIKIEEKILLFELLSNNFFKFYDKRLISISIKTIFGVVSFISKTNQNVIEREFSKIGDVGEICSKYLFKKDNQKSLQKKKVSFFDIKNSIILISKINGKNSNKRKIEILTNIFLNLNEEIEFYFLAKLLIGDFQIGVNNGVLNEALINFYFTNILDYNFICSNNHINLNNEKCYLCNEKIDKKNQLELLKNFDYKIYDLKDFNEKSFDDYVKSFDEKMFFKIDSPREFYNFVKEKFEEKYNCVNSYEKVILDIKKDKKNLIVSNLEIFMGVKSMLATREDNVENSLKTISLPFLADFKYDGIRMQIHNNYGEIKIFTRNLEEISDKFPEICDFFLDNFSKDIFIIDCETIGFDYVNKKTLPFQVLSRRILTKDYELVKHIKTQIKAFDIMMLNEKNLIHTPYKKRREILENLFLNKEMKVRK